MSTRSNAIIGALGAVVAAIAGGFVTRCTIENELRYTVVVLDDDSSTGIEKAGVRLNAGSDSITDVTDSAGKHTFSLSSKLAGEHVKVLSTKDGYHEASEENSLPAKQGWITLRMKKLTTTVIKPPEVASATTNRVPNSESPPGTTLTAAAAAATTASAAAPPDVRTTTESLSFTSAPVPSGSGSNWSNWAELCSGSLPPNAVIVSASFALSGDRSCGAWSECRQTSQTPTQVCYQFRMQGHNEWPAPGQALSVGNLKITISRPIG